MLTPFLQQVAEAFVTVYADELIDYCFVFPNKRCSTFFNSYMTKLLPEASFLPATTSIDTFITELTRSVMMPRIEQLFVLYDCYRKIVRKNTGQEPSIFFDSFLTWGETVLNDFNDVDRYMADADQLFRNIKYFKEIAANFLTEEQVEIINRYWRDPITYSADAGMWKHLDKGENQAVKNFFSLWIVLHELYEMFRSELDKRRLTYPGKMYRDAVGLLKSDEFSPDSLPYKRYIFVGFNALSASEEKIFSYFRDHGIGDFYWDYASPAFESKQNPANMFVGQYIRRFPSDPLILNNLNSEKITEFPEIEIIGIPSAIGQAKKAAKILENIVTDSKNRFTPEKARHTAVVLPDESLCMPLVNSLPPAVRPINITMGYPIKNTPVAFLIKNIIKLQERARLIKGEHTFYFEDIRTLLAHPLLRSSYPRQCEEIIRKINDGHIFNYPHSLLTSEYPELSDFFIIFDENGSIGSLHAVGKLLNHLKRITEGNGLEHAFVINYLRSLETVEKMCRRYDVELSHSTIFQLLHRLAGGETVHFAGEPLEGIQIMGMLETRALDFETLIILSMNERIFPRAIQSRSFIPMELRRGYGLSTIDHQESIFAYYFYRLISRAKKVYLLYDTRTGSVTGEMSRYLYQLIYLYSPSGLKHYNMGYSISTPEKRVITIEKSKSPEIMEKINRFRQPDSGVYLSASSINRYIECPLAFYLENIAGYRVGDELKDYIDDGLYGTIMHSVAENLYHKASVEFGTDVFTPPLLNRLIATKRNLIEHEVTSAIKQFYYKVDRGLLPAEGLRVSDLPGDTEILGDILCDFTVKMLRRESESTTFGNFQFIGAEKRFQGNVSLSDRLTINIKGFIDRIDRLITPVTGESTLRFVDYKTGSDTIVVKEPEELFNVDSTDRPKAVLQLMLYCNAYSKLYNTHEPITPFIYQLKKLSISPLDYIRYAGEPLQNYQTVNDRFLELLDEHLSPLFDPDVPFTQAKNPDKACKFCKFLEICDKKIKKV